MGARCAPNAHFSSRKRSVIRRVRWSTRVSAESESALVNWRAVCALGTMLAVCVRVRQSGYVRRRECRVVWHVRWTDGRVLGECGSCTSGSDRAAVPTWGVANSGEPQCCPTKRAMPTNFGLESATRGRSRRSNTSFPGKIVSKLGFFSELRLVS